MSELANLIKQLASLSGILINYGHAVSVESVAASHHLFNQSHL